MIFSVARTMALPPTARLREPYVPMPIGVLAVSPCSISTMEASMPIMSATTCGKAVSWPCPCECEPVMTVIPPVALTRTVALS